MTDRHADLHVVSELEFVVEHTIESTPERIFDAYTEPDLIVQWWAHPGKTMRIEQMDVRPGGAWRFVHVGEDEETVMHGTYREVEPGKCLSYTYNHGEGTANEILAIVDLEPVEEGTRVRLTNRCSSPEQRDAMVAHGAEAGAKAALKALAALLRRN